MNPRYWAFLSYSHADEKSAQRLHRALEAYTLPAAVRRAHQLPKRLIPVFRDVDELEAAAGLSTRLRNALDDSRWLIVLCSKNAAQSRYVNAEIEYFVGKHGPGRVLCVLNEGEPPDCFPPAIRAFTEEPLAADMRVGADFELALVKLIAAVSLIGFTELRNREAQRKQRVRWAAGALALLGVAAAGVYWDLERREFVEDYAHYTRVNGIWTGVDPLPAGSATRRHEVYRFTRHGRRNPPASVDFIDGATGACPEGGMLDWLPKKGLSQGKTPNIMCNVTFDYGLGNALVGETHFAFGYYTNGFTFGQNSAHGEMSSSTRVVLDRDEAGFDRRLRWYNTGIPVVPLQALLFGRDSSGHVVRRSVAAWNDSVPMRDREYKETGEVTLTRWSLEGLPVEIRHVDLQGKPRMGAEGFSIAKLTYDADGNVSATEFLDVAGQPVQLAVKPLLRRLYNE